MKRFLLAAVIGGSVLAGVAALGFAQELETNLGALTPENAKGYLSPLPKSLSTTLNMGAFQSANIPLAGFNFTVGVYAMGSTFDDGDRTYSPTDPPGFQSTAPVAAPTVIGDTHAVTQPGQGGTTLYHPGGFDLSQFVLAVPQVSIGSVFGTRAVVRWISVKMDDNVGDVSVFGVGLQHSLKRYLPELPVDLALGAMYQKFHVGDDDLIKTNSFHGEVMASKSFGVLQPYVGVGFDTFTMEVNYDQDVGGTTESVNVQMDDENSAHLTGGMLLAFPLVKLNAQIDSGARTGASIGLRFGTGH